MQRDRTSRQGSPAIARPPIRPKCNGRRRHQPCRSPNERRRRTRTTDEAYTEAPYKRSYGRSRTSLYNEERPHSALGYVTPLAYAANLSATCDRLRNPDHMWTAPWQALFRRRLFGDCGHMSGLLMRSRSSLAMMLSASSGFSSAPRARSAGRGTECPGRRFAGSPSPHCALAKLVT